MNLKKLFSLTAGLSMTIAFTCLTVATPAIYQTTRSWLGRWFISEKFLLINGWLNTLDMFPNFGWIQMLVLYLLLLSGLVFVSIPTLRFLKIAWTKVPAYRDHKEIIVRWTAIFLISLILGLVLGSVELNMRDPIDGPDILIGERLTPPSTWGPQLRADKRGMTILPMDLTWPDSLHHVNQQGFLSTLDYTRETVDSIRKSGKIIVFVIGDSFVEGFTTGTWNHTFCELLQEDLIEKAAIFNFGISGTDPLDYKLIVQKFIPELKPDLALLCFCGSNDIMTFDRIATPEVPALWTMNRTFFYSNLYNKVILPSPDSLYRYLVNNTSSKRASNFAAKWLCQKSSFATLIYARLFPWLPELDGKSDTCEASFRNLLEIDQLCSRDSIPFQVAFIPDKKNLKSSLPEYKIAYKNVFKNLEDRVSFPEGITKEDFGNGSDIHFNDAGNRIFADFLKNLILGKAAPANIKN